MTASAWELADLDGLGQAALVARGALSRAELAEAALERIEELNERLGAVAWTNPDAAEEGVADGGPLAGAPILVKDIGTQARGAPRWDGSRYLDGTVDTHDSDLVARFRRAGLTVVGKSCCSEFANSSETSWPARTDNPWDPSRSPGGSSAGAAAAVAAGIVPIAHATDDGGSIRWPAAWCGLFGLKPSRGRNPLGPDGGEGCGGISAAHVVTRSVRDSAAVLDATSGSGEGYLDGLEVDPGPLRIALSDRVPAGKPLDDACRSAVRASASLCEELGHHVEEAEPTYDAALLEAEFHGLTCDGNAAAIDALEAELGRAATDDELQPLTRWLIEQGRGRSASDHVNGVGRLNQVGRAAVPFFAEHDVLLTPATRTPALPHADLTPTDETAEAIWFELELGGADFLLLANVLGYPAMSVPLWWTRDGLPVGSHFTAAAGREDVLLRLARQLEQSSPWADRRPPIHEPSNRPIDRSVNA